MYEHQLDIENKINAACYGLGLSREQVRNAIKKRMESGDMLEDVLKRVLSGEINLQDSVYNASLTGGLAATEVNDGKQ